RGEIEDVPISAGGEHDCVREMRLDRARDQVARHDPSCVPIDNDQVEHLRPWVHRYAACVHLMLERLVAAKQQLLPSLSACVERPRHRRAAEGAVCEKATVLASERYTLRDALIDDVHADLRQPIDVRFARAEIAALYGIVEQAVDAVAVVLIVLRSVDAA